MTKKINFEVMKLHFLSGLIWVFSSSAIAQMGNKKKKQDKGLVDQVAAALILQEYLSQS